MDPLTVLASAVEARAPEYVILVIISMFVAYLWTEIKTSRATFAEQDEAMAKQVKALGDSVILCQTANVSSAAAAASSLAEYKLLMAEKTPTRAEVVEMIDRSNKSVIAVLDAMKEDLRWIRGQVSPGKD